MHERVKQKKKKSFWSVIIETAVFYIVVKNVIRPLRASRPQWMAVPRPAG